MLTPGLNLGPPDVAQVRNTRRRVALAILLSRAKPFLSQQSVARFHASATRVCDRHGACSDSPCQPSSRQAWHLGPPAPPSAGLASASAHPPKRPQHRRLRDSSCGRRMFLVGSHAGGRLAVPIDAGPEPASFRFAARPAVSQGPAIALPTLKTRMAQPARISCFVFICFSSCSRTRAPARRTNGKPIGRPQVPGGQGNVAIV